MLLDLYNLVITKGDVKSGRFEKLWEKFDRLWEN